MTSNHENRKLFIGAIIGVLMIFIFWVGSAILILKLYPSPEFHGAFGDLFGAINALFSGLAFLGVIIAIILQKMELEEQRREIKESRIAQEKTASALSNQLLLQYKQAQIQGLNLLITSINQEIERLMPRRTEASTQKVKELSKERDNYEKKLRQLLNEINKDNE